MCEFFSALVTRQGEMIWDPATDSHTDLIDSCGLRNVEDSECSYFAKIEFTPSSRDKADEIDGYTLRVDEYNEPGWFDDEMRENIIKKCRSIVSRMILTGEHKCILSGKYIIGKGAKIGRTVNSNIVAMLESSKVGEMLESSQVGEMLESSQVGEMWGSSQVGAMRESSQVGTMWGSSQVGAMRESSQVKDDQRIKETK